MLIGITFWAIVLLLSLWVAVDSSRLKLVRYNTGLSYKPLLLFFLMIPIWYISFPWYLVVRARIRSGKLVPVHEASKRASQGLHSPKAKLGMLAVAAGIVIAVACAGVSHLTGASGQPLPLLGIMVLSLAAASVVFGCILVLLALVSDRLRPWR